MHAVRVNDPIKDAIEIIDSTLERIKNLMMRENLSTIRGYVVEAQAQAHRWHANYNVPPMDEPKAVKQAIDETRFFWGIRDLMRDDSEHQAQRQYHDRALAAILALLTRRYIVLQGAGRVTGDMIDANAEEWAMWHGFERGRSGWGSAPSHTSGAAIQEAHQVGLKGGSWASVVLDGQP